MQLEFIAEDGHKFAKLISEEIMLKDEQDAVELAANCYYNGAEGVIVREQQIVPDFFDLKTRVAGEMLQKFTNYRVKVAIIGDFSKFESKSLHNFIYESNQRGHVLFVNSVEEALDKLIR